MVAVPARGTIEPVIYWTEDFESYPAGSTIDGKDTSWGAGEPNPGQPTGVVVGVDGDNALWNRFVGGCAWGSGEVIWWNDTGHTPTGSQVFSFSIKPAGSPEWSVQGSRHNSPPMHPPAQRTASCIPGLRQHDHAWLSVDSDNLSLASISTHLAFLAQSDMSLTLLTEKRRVRLSRLQRSECASWIGQPKNPATT